MINLLRRHANSQLVRTVPTRKSKTRQLESTERAVKAVGKRPAISKTSLETSQETSAAEETAADGLVEELVTHDLNRGDAIRLAREKPDQCRRQLEYLKFLIQTHFVFRRSKGGYLYTAIKEENGPPTGYEEARRAEAQSIKERAHQSAELAHSAAKQNRLRKTLDRLEIDQPAVYSAFLEYVEKNKQVALDKPILRSAPEVRDLLIRSFETDAMRLELFEDYLTAQTVRPA